MLKNNEPSFQFFSYDEDQPQKGRGSLIPGNVKNHPKHTFTPVSAVKNFKGTRIAVSLVAFLAIITLGTAGYGVALQSNLASVKSSGDYNEKSVVSLIEKTHLSDDDFYVEARGLMIDDEETFIEIDVNSRQLRFFQKGVLFKSAEILAVGKKGSWWDTPSGLYNIESKEENSFSNIGQAYLPWKLTFQGNFMIHGVPTDTNSHPISLDMSIGDIVLEDKVAQDLFEVVSVGLPVLVHNTSEELRDTFVYEPQVLDINAPHYFIADISNGTVLAATDLDSVVPIASLTKLMTAVIAAETLDLDGRLKVTSPTFVTSLIPRLSQRSSVSLYSLMQLLLVESSNEAAETIAGENGRSEFIEVMNSKARQLGMMKTHFSDPSGLSSENVSSISDLYLLTKYIYDNRSFIFEITINNKLPNANIGDEFSSLINFNEIEGIDSFVGGKVGETLAAKQTSISLHNLLFQGEERTIVVIVLGSDNRKKDVQSLVSYTDIHFNR